MRATTHTTHIVRTMRLPTRPALARELPGLIRAGEIAMEGRTAR